GPSAGDSEQSLQPLPGRGAPRNRDRTGRARRPQRAGRAVVRGRVLGPPLQANPAGWLGLGRSDGSAWRACRGAASAACRDVAIDRTLGRPRPEDIERILGTLRLWLRQYP